VIGRSRGWIPTSRQAGGGRSGVAGIGWAQEFQRIATCTITEARHGGAPHFGWERAERRVTCPSLFGFWDGAGAELDAVDPKPVALAGVDAFIQRFTAALLVRQAALEYH
jgi:hypothetical protein